MTRFIFIRHASPIIDKSLSPREWILSKEGEKQVVQLTREGVVHQIDLLVSSQERKAILTAEGIRNALDHKKIPEIITDKRLNEVDRTKGPFFDTFHEFKTNVKKTFIERDKSFFTWEPIESAVARIIDCIDELQTKYSTKHKTIGIVSHGTIISLYFAKVGEYYDNPAQIIEKWENMPFCAWGLIAEGKIQRAFG